MRRRIVITLCAVSLMLCVAISLLWVRTHKEREFYEIVLDGSRYWVFTKPGQLVFNLSPEAGKASHRMLLGHSPYPIKTTDGGTWAPPIFSRSELSFSFNRFGTKDWQFAGARVYQCAVPIWFFILLFALPPLMVLRGDMRKRRRRAASACLHCGYDLRASSGRCPECGHAIPSTKAPGAPSESRTPQPDDSTALKTPSAPEK
jgi:hypothetical protein